MEDYCVYEIFFSFGVFYIDRNQYGNIQILGMIIISRSIVLLLVLNALFPLCLDLEKFKIDSMYLNDPGPRNGNLRFSTLGIKGLS